MNIKLIFLPLALLLLVVMALFGLARLSQNRANAGLIDGKLRGCPQSPNCHSTEAHPETAIRFAPEGREKAWLGLQQIITEQGGIISSVNDDYLWATFRSRLFGFVDDLEARVDEENHRIHLRSASRIGYSDFTANRRRVQRIQRRLAIHLNPALLRNSGDAPAAR